MSDRADSSSNDSDYEASNASIQQPNSKGCRMLRPSLFSTNLTTHSSKFCDGKEALDQPKNNPFLKEYKEDDTVPGQKNSQDEQSKTKVQSEDGDKANLLNKKSLPKSNLFSSVQSSIPVENIGFVFGQNVHERVTGENLKSTTNNSTGESSTSADTENKDKSSELLFANAIQNSNNKIDKEPAVKSTELRSLTEVAREYEESRATKRKYEEVETFTGEENEQNILDISCKLFAFVNSNWEERGRGSLRLNDSKEQKEASRVVFRTSGNLRLLVNTKVWPDMIAERPSPKSLRLTAMDNNGHIKIFLAMSRPDDINIIYNALVKRISILKENIESDSDSIKENQKATDEEENQEKEPTTNEQNTKKSTLEQQN